MRITKAVAVKSQIAFSIKTIVAECLCAYVPASAPFSVSGTPLPGGTGENEEDRGLPALRTLQVDVPVWSGYAEAFGGEL